MRYSIFVSYFTQNKLNIDSFFFSLLFAKFRLSYIAENKANMCMKSPYLLSVLHPRCNKIVNLVYTVYIIVLSWSTVGKLTVKRL